MSSHRVAYGKKTFTQVRSELYSMIRQYYPEVLSDFSDSSVGGMLVDLNAGVSNSLSVSLDRAFQETQREYAQQRSSLLGMARTLNLAIPNKRASVTVVDYTVNIPVKGDQPDESYYPTLAINSQVVGGGKTFENTDIIDWKSSVSALGFPNRSIIPNKNANGIILNYSVTKREVVINGTTNVFKKIITANETVPFYQLTLPDPDVIEISDVILIQGTNFTGEPPESDWQNEEYKFHEVESLAEQRVFVEDSNSGSNNSTTGSTGIKAGIWTDVTQKFTKEFTENGFCVLTFGGGNGELDRFRDGLLKADISNNNFLDNYLNNTSLGERLKEGYTLFVRYRTGGGAAANLGANSLTSLGRYNMTVLGSRQDFNKQVERSLTVTNPIPAIGGNDGLSNEQIRQLISRNFASQNRGVTINDYLVKTLTMPGKYGSPFRANAFRENNKVVIPIIGLNSSGKLDNTSNTVLKNNITEYLSKFRMVNDYIEVRDGRIFNIALDIELFIDDINEQRIANLVINTVASYFDINNREMNEDIFITELYEQINNVVGVINVIDITVYNKVGGEYSSNVVEQDLVSLTTGEISLINNAIYSTEDSMFEIKYPERDIKLYLRKKSNLGV